jgi:hypothetical protein
MIDTDDSAQNSIPLSKFAVVIGLSCKSSQRPRCGIAPVRLATACSSMGVNRDAASRPINLVGANGFAI